MPIPSCSGASELQAMLAGGTTVQHHYTAVLAAEDAADAITREVLLAVRRTFITPFDRSDIQDLIGPLDDAIDQMQKTAKAITLFELTDFGRRCAQLGDIVVRSAELLREAVPLLARMSPNADPDQPLCEQIRQVEGEADDVHDAGVASAVPPGRSRRERWPSSSAGDLRPAGEGGRPLRGRGQPHQGIVVEHV